MAFGIVPRHYHQVPDADFMIYTDYPVADIKSTKKSFTAQFIGDERLTCRMVILKKDEKKLPSFKVLAEKSELKGKHLKNGDLEFEISGDQQLKITW